MAEIHFRSNSDEVVFPMSRKRDAVKPGDSYDEDRTPTFTVLYDGSGSCRKYGTGRKREKGYGDR